MSKAVEFDAIEVQSIIRMIDYAQSQPVEGITVAAYPTLTAYYRRDFGLGVEVPLHDKVALDAPWAEGGLSELSDGYYAIDTPNDAFLSGSRAVLVIAHEPANTFMCVGAYHPLQRTLESVSFITDAGIYCTAEDIYDVFGKANVWKWANLEGLDATDPDYETNILARIDKAIVYATADINDKLRGGPYTIPFTDGMHGASINYACAIKAGIWLYEWRGADDYDMEGGRLVHRYTFMADRSDKMLEQIRRAARILDSEPGKVEGTRAPGIVPATSN